MTESDSERVAKLLANPRLLARMKEALGKTFFVPYSSEVSISPASTKEDYKVALTNVQGEFVRLKFIKPGAVLRARTFELLPEEYTFVAKRNNEIIGVQSIVRDTPEFSLPSDSQYSKWAYSKEINELRESNKRAEGKSKITEVIYEATNELVIQDPKDAENGLKPASRNRGIAGGFMQGLIALISLEDRKRNEQSTIITAVDPQKEDVYKHMGFVKIGGEREYGQTKDRTILVALDVNHAEESSIQQDGLLKKPYLRNYFFKENSFFNSIPTMLSKPREIFTDPQNLEWLLKAGEVNDLTPQQLRGIQEKWANPFVWGSPQITTPSGSVRPEYSFPFLFTS